MTATGIWASSNATTSDVPYLSASGLDDDQGGHLSDYPGGESSWVFETSLVQ